MRTKNKGKGSLSQDEMPIPDFSQEAPKTINSVSYRKAICPSGDNKTLPYLPGTGSGETPLMFVANSIYPQEWATEIDMGFNTFQNKKPEMLYGPTGDILRDICTSVGLDLDTCYYTALCRWPMAKELRNSPKKREIEWGKPSLLHEINKVKPRVIVCLGKAVFDVLMGSIKISQKDAMCGWFYSELANCEIFLAHDLGKAQYRVELATLLAVDVAEVARHMNLLSNVKVPSYEQKYSTIHNAEELQELVGSLETNNSTVLSVDCEWHGHSHIDGDLRSIQICWAPGEAAYIRFRDEQNKYVFDVDYKEAGSILSAWLDRKEVKYIGHHISADLPWMHHVLGLNWYRKTLLDTEFALQCCDEYQELALERLAMNYTDFGRYDQDLVMWKRQNPRLCHSGYGFIPDEIIIPYALKDVDTVMRAYPCILDELFKQELFNYYSKILNPMVSDVFTSFAIEGLPMDKERMDELRELMNFSRVELEKQLRRDLFNEAQELLKERLVADNIENPESIIESILDCMACDEDPKTVLPESISDETVTCMDHLLATPKFNIRSFIHMRRWLFEVKKYTPIKSTANREAGRPSIDWSKVQELPPHTRSKYLPAYDVQTLEILSEKHKDKIIDSLLNLNKIGNLCKSMLPSPTTDEDGKIVEETGQLYKFLSSDGKIHGQTSTTETGRPRAWNPNVLNWPAYVDHRITGGVRSALEQAEREGALPPNLRKYLDHDVNIPSIRSCVKAPEGWCMVESDYATAEIRGLAFISGDDNLIRIMTEPDPQFVLTTDGNVVRLGYSDDCGIPESLQHPDLILAKPKSIVVKDGQLVKVTDHYTAADIKIDDQGKFVRPSVDLHWSLAELTNKKPRELMTPKVERAAAKVGNFSSAYGASPGTLERKIEQDTGIEQPEGAGQSILDALKHRQPEATAFLENMQDIPWGEKQYRAASGRIRHFASHPDNIKISFKDKKSLMSSLGREARNFPMQESVAATAARAASGLLYRFTEEGMLARPMIVLYDSVVTLCPLEEAEQVAALHQEYMTDSNCWEYHGRTMNYPIDTEFNVRWSTKPEEGDVVPIIE